MMNSVPISLHRQTEKRDAVRKLAELLGVQLAVLKAVDDAASQGTDGLARNMKDDNWELLWNSRYSCRVKVFHDN